MKVVTTLPQQDLRAVPGAAQAAEADGYDGVITMENKNNALLAHAVAAVSTESIELGTAIVIAFGRSPMVTASAAWDLQIASRGRFVLGIGPQVRAHNERRFSVPWSPPVPRLREYVQALRQIWTCWEKGTPLKFEGEHYRFTLMTPAFTPDSLGLPMVPIRLAGVGPHSLRLAGEVADGVLLHPFTTRLYMEKNVLPLVEQGLQSSGRSLDHFEINGGGFVATGSTQEEVDQNFEWVRERIGFYASTPAYWPVLEAHDMLDLGEKMNALSKQGKWKEMAEGISDDVVRMFTAVGRHDEIAQAIEAHFGGLSDCISASPNSYVPSTLPPDVIQDIRRIPCRFKGFKSPW